MKEKAGFYSVWRHAASCNSGPVPAPLLAASQKNIRAIILKFMEKRDCNAAHRLIILEHHK
jgi:hypothetical protein